MQEWCRLRLFDVMVHADAVFHYLPYENETLPTIKSKPKKTRIENFLFCIIQVLYITDYHQFQSLHLHELLIDFSYQLCEIQGRLLHDYVMIGNEK